MGVQVVGRGVGGSNVTNRSAKFPGAILMKWVASIGDEKSCRSDSSCVSVFLEWVGWVVRM